MQGAVIALERQRAAHLREIAALEAERRELPLRSRAAQRARSSASWPLVAQQSAENAARQRIVVRAPQDGTGQRRAGRGRAERRAGAGAGEPDAGRRAPAGAALRAVERGRLPRGPTRPCMLRYQAFPYQKFGHQGGQVVQVSRAPLQPSELAGAAAGRRGGFRRAAVPDHGRLDTQDVAAYGATQPLAPGMQLDADVLLDRRRLIEWIFEPVLGIAGRV